jgi:hypothetical protein
MAGESAGTPRPPARRPIATTRTAGAALSATLCARTVVATIHLAMLRTSAIRVHSVAISCGVQQPEQMQPLLQLQAVPQLLFAQQSVQTTEPKPHVPHEHWTQEQPVLCVYPHGGFRPLHVPEQHVVYPEGHPPEGQQPVQQDLPATQLQSQVASATVNLPSAPTEAPANASGSSDAVRLSSERRVRVRATASLARLMASSAFVTFIFMSYSPPGIAPWLSDATPTVACRWRWSPPCRCSVSNSCRNFRTA